jgi:hypothetical protein
VSPTSQSSPLSPALELGIILSVCVSVISPNSFRANWTATIRSSCLTARQRADLAADRELLAADRELVKGDVDKSHLLLRSFVPGTVPYDGISGAVAAMLSARTESLYLPYSCRVADDLKVNVPEQSRHGWRTTVSS